MPSVHVLGPVYRFGPVSTFKPNIDERGVGLFDSFVFERPVRSFVFDFRRDSVGKPKLRSIDE